MLKKRRKTFQSNKGKKFPSRERIQPNKNKTRVDVLSKEILSFYLDSLIQLTQY